MKRLSLEEWSVLARQHRNKASQWTVPHRERSASGQMHPVYDFLFIYYRNPPSQLEAWHPGLNYRLDAEQPMKAFNEKYYSFNGSSIMLDPSKMSDTDRHRIEMALTLSDSVQARPPQFGCYGMHEWAMVYRGRTEGEVRHREKLPLRLAEETINTFLQERPLSCSHFDAFRFFTPSAKRFNRIQPLKEERLANEQAGCLHTNMDLYKLAAQCMPWVGSDLLWQTFELALEARVLDMEASPYDCRTLGLGCVPVETKEGRRLYEKRQKSISEQAKPIRRALICSLQSILEQAKRKTLEI